MKLKLLTSAILLSTTALTAAAALDESTEASMYVVTFKQGEEFGYNLIQGGQALATVFTSKVVRAKSDYVVCETNNSLSHAFRPISEGVLRQWVDGVEFLLETLQAGLEYSQSLKEDQRSAGSVSEIRAADHAFLNRLFGTALDIHQKLTIGPLGFLPEGPLNHLYQDIMSAIDEIQQHTNPLSRHLIDSMYVPVRDWIKVNLPVCQMYEYVRPQVTTISGEQTKIEYFWEAKRYFDGYLYQTDQYKKIRIFAENNPAERENFQLELRSFINSTCIELCESETNSDPRMLYVRFLEGVKEREIAFIETWISKVRKEEAKLDVRRAQLTEYARAEKARKARDPKAMLDEMERTMGLDDESQKHAQSKQKKVSSSKKASEETSPAKRAKPAESPVTQPPSLEKTTSVAIPTAEISRMSEVEKLAKLDATKAENAKRNAEQQARKLMLQERRAETAEREERVLAALEKRCDNWVERALKSDLSVASSSQKISLSELNLNPDFETACAKLRSIGCYVDTNIHGNEKGIARWVGADGKNVMVWFDRPHGAQLTMGVAAGWFKALVKRLRETGMLAS